MPVLAKQLKFAFTFGIDYFSAIWWVETERGWFWIRNTACEGGEGEKVWMPHPLKCSRLVWVRL